MAIHQKKSSLNSSISSVITVSTSSSTFSAPRLSRLILLAIFFMGLIELVSSDRFKRTNGKSSPNVNQYLNSQRRGVTLRSKKIRLTLSPSSSTRGARTHILTGTQRHNATRNSNHERVPSTPYQNKAPAVSNSRKTRLPSRSRSYTLGDTRHRVTSARRRLSRSGGHPRASSSSRNGGPSRNGGTNSRPSYSRTSSRSSHPGSSSRKPSSYRRKAVRSSRPNIVVIMTDDQDVLLGSLNAMPKLANLMTRQGVFFNNSFVSTPMCCPSRSSFLTGMYVHNHNVYTNNYNCSSPQWQRLYESRGFATYVNNTHMTGYFGKYLNEYNGSHTPAGWGRWVGLIKNTRFYNYSVINERGEITRHEDNYYKDYLTDLVANDSCSFLQESKKRHPDKPVMMVLSLPAPHGPEDAAPQYQHMFVNNTDHRTPAWNYAPNPDKQWLLRNMYKMMPQHKIFTDLLQRRRLQTLQSVDDLVEKVVGQLDMLGELENTYIIYTSDHGYHLGQFGVIKGKGLPYDFDVKVPLIIRGPGIIPGTIISNIVNNIDLAPTIIDMAGGSVPDHMDGQSFLRLIKASKDRKNVDAQGFVSLKKPWRDTILLERGKLTLRAMRKKMQTEEQIIFNQVSDRRMHFYIPMKTRRLAIECSKESNRLPCKPQQKWYCIEDNGRLRKHKCRNNRLTKAGHSKTALQKDEPFITKPCECPPRRGRKPAREKRKNRRFLKRHARTDYRARYHRRKRSLESRAADIGSDDSSEGDDNGGFGGFESMFNRRCRILSNQSVLCDLDIYQKTKEWESHKARIDDMIKEYRKALEDLRDIRRHLRKQRPLDSINQEIEESEDTISEMAKSDVKNLCQCDENGRVVYEPSKRRRIKIDRIARKRLRRRKKKRKNQTCNMVSMNCFTHDNHHWKTPPYWEYGPFCFCSNSNNNTYWCLRTINETHNFLYCEFITTFMSYYDVNTDPYQLKNIVTELNYGILQQLHEELKKLKHCAGAKDCMLRSGQKNRLPHEPQWPGLIHLQRSKPGKMYNDSATFSYDVDGNDDVGINYGRRKYSSRHHRERRKNLALDFE